MSKTTDLSMIGFALFVLVLVGGSTAVDGDGLLFDRRRARTLSAAEALTGGADRWRDFDTVEWRADEEFVAAPRTAEDDRLLLQRIVRQRRDAPNQPHIEKYMVSYWCAVFNGNARLANR